MAIDIQGFIAESRLKGMSDDAIRSALASMGIDQLEVNAAIPTTHIATTADGTPVSETAHKISDFLAPTGTPAQPAAVAAQKPAEPVEEVTVVPGPDIPNPKKKMAVIIGVVILVAGIAAYFLVLKK